MAAIYLALDVDAALCTLGDACPDAVTLHRMIRDRRTDLISALHAVNARGTSKSAFLAVRRWRPTSQPERAARFLYLLTHGFRGVYRVNSQGEYNVTWDDSSANRCVLDLVEGIDAVSARLQRSRILFGGFEAVIANHLEHHPNGVRWLYLDPPYLGTFSQYTKDGFSHADHVQLANTIGALSQRGVRVMLSNSDALDTITVYGQQLDLYRVQVTHASGASGSRKQTELIGINYCVDDMVDADTFLRCATPM